MRKPLRIMGHSSRNSAPIYLFSWHRDASSGVDAAQRSREDFGRLDISKIWAEDFAGNEIEGSRKLNVTALSA